MPKSQMTILEAQAALAAGTLTAVELTQQHLDAIIRLNPSLNAFHTVLETEALTAAAESDKRHEKGEKLSFLDGIPIAVKCNLSVTNCALTGGVEARKGVMAVADAPAVKMLREAGAVILGTTKMDEGGMSATGENPSDGRTINPYGDAMRPLGSSSGSAVAVSSGMAIGAIGTDALGSVRLPAAACGITGLKPSKNLIDTSGLATCSWTFETIGPLARTSDDAFLLLAGMLGVPMDPRKLDTKIQGMVIGVPREFINSSPLISDEVKRHFEAVLNVFIGLGVQIKDIGLIGYDLEAARKASWLVTSVEAYEFHLDDLQANPDGYSEPMRAMMEFGAQSSDEMRLKAVAAIAAAGDAVDHALMQVEALLLPTLPTLDIGYDKPVNPRIADFTSLANMLGVPAITVPSAIGNNGVPFGFQIVTESLAERKAVRIAKAFELAAGHIAGPKVI